MPFFADREIVPFRVAKTNKTKSMSVDGNYFKKSNVADIEGQSVNCNLFLKNYQNKLEEIFLDVKKGDRKTAFFNHKNGVKLYFNGKFAGAINDLVFAKRFFDIWLSDKSSYPKMTQAILGKNE